MKTLIKVGVFILLFVTALQVSTYVLRDKTNAEFLCTFQEEKENSLDVLLLGSSHSFAHIIPMELWSEYGITSYNLGTSEQSLAQSYELLKYAFNRQSPKLVVLEMYAASYSTDFKGGVSLARDHQVADNLELSFDKARYIYSTVEEENRAEFFFPIIAYHERWKNLSEKDFQPIKNPNKGANLGYNMYQLKENEIVEIDRTLVEELPEHIVRKIEEISVLCDAHGAELMLVLTPYPNVKEKYAKFSAIFDLAEELDCSYLYLLDQWEELGLDYETDVKDSTHLNMAGAAKVTKHIGGYIKNTYDIPDRRDDPDYSYWHDDYEAYREYALVNIYKTKPAQQNYFLSLLNHDSDYLTLDALRTRLCNAQTIEEYLRILKAEKELTVVLTAKDEFSKNLAEEALAELSSMGFEINDDNGLFRYSFIGVLENGAVKYGAVSPEKQEYAFVDFVDRKVEIASAGYTEGNISSVKINGQEYSMNRRGLNIVVWDTATGYLVDSVRFDTYSTLIGDR